MWRAVVTAIAGGLMCNLSLAVPAAPAQQIPLPVPAPAPKTGTLAQTTPTGSVIAPPKSAPPQSIEQLLDAKPASTAVTRPGETVALNATQRDLADRVSGYLSSVQTLVGNFVQVGPDGRRTEGKFSLQKPGRVRFEYAAPSLIDVIADGQSVVVRDRKLATQDLYPLSQTPLRFLLSERLDLLKDTNLVGVTADDVFVTVVIEEKQPIIGTNRLMLMFGAKDFQLKQWTVTDPQGFDTTVAVYNLDAATKPDPALFKINYERVLELQP
ncbi:MAG: outer-membrane lipoprotein carrier protein LolA [Proteobacteria bacterium]|nr:outer-membrane lipoprotein carrier protein LolA [Pseudomonadota bacterium]